MSQSFRFQSWRLFPVVGALLLLAVAGAAAAAERPPYDSGRVGYELRVRDELNPYRVFGVFVMPGEVVPLALEGHDDLNGFRIEAARGEVHAEAPGRWSWRAPREPGHYTLWVRPQEGPPMRLNALVMVPAERVVGGKLNGYRIGQYPRTPLRGLAIYLPPAGFIELRPGQEGIEVSPHFTLGQFLCKQDGGPTKYLVLRERLVLKLEFILERLNEAGHRIDGFQVMSGYRTPHYNAAIGNVPYSRHVWGGAADIFIDEHPRDGRMDDLNGDGRSDAADASYLYDFIEQFYQRPVYASFVGGLGRYRSTRAHGPFVHVDVRGNRARWGR